MKHARFSIPWRRVLPVCAALVLAVGGLWAGTLDLTEGAQPQTAMRVGATSSKSAGAPMYASYSAADYAADYAAEDGMVMGANSLMDTAAYGGAGGTQMAAEQPRKLVRTADLTLRTQQFDQAVQQVEALLAEQGGYVENLYQYGESLRRLTLSMRVPSDRLDAFVQGAQGVGRVTDRSESTTDMTVQYADNAARLATLYAKRDRLNELLVQAADVSDLIEIESAIADTQYQIDSYESAQRSIDSRVDMSAVNVTLVEEKPADVAAADVSLGERIRSALSASVEWTGEFLRDVLVFAVMILPIAVPVTAVCIVLWLIRRRKRKENSK